MAFEIMARRDLRLYKKGEDWIGIESLLLENTPKGGKILKVFHYIGRPIYCTHRDPIIFGDWALQAYRKSRVMWQKPKITRFLGYLDRKLQKKRKL